MGIKMASITLDDEIHRKVKTKCTELNIKIKDVANELFSSWLKKVNK